MHAQAHTSYYDTCSRQTWFWYVINLKLITLCFTSHHLSWQELSSNLFQACLWCKCFPPTIWFGLRCSWRTFHTFLLEQRDVKAFFLIGIGLNLLHVSNLAQLHWKWWAFAFTIRLLLVLRLSWGGLVLCKFSFVWEEHPASVSSLVWINAGDWRLPEMQIRGVQLSALVPHPIQNKRNIFLYVYSSQPDSQQRPDKIIFRFAPRSDYRISAW